MNLKITQPNTGIETYEMTAHKFDWVSEWGGGLSFDVDEHGEPALDDMHINGLMNYIRAILGTELAPYGYEDEEGTDTSYEVINKGVVTTTYQRRVYREGLCNCGRKVYLDKFTNACPCGVDYDSAGVALAPRSQWGEDTGEHWSVCF